MIIQGNNYGGLLYQNNYARGSLLKFQVGRVFGKVGPVEPHLKLGAGLPLQTHSVLHLMSAVQIMPLQVDGPQYCCILQFLEKRSTFPSAIAKIMKTARVMNLRLAICSFVSFWICK